MKKKLLLIIGLFMISVTSFGQAASSYAFTAVSGSYISLTGVPGVVDTSLGATADTGVSSSITLPFAFTFAGTAYSAIKVSPNGWVSFGAATVTDAQNSTNSLVNAVVTKPVLFPLWDDLMCTVKPRYVTTGIFPHRRFKVEWSQQKWDAQSSGDVISFQIWFFETTNVIEFLYNQEATFVNNSSSGASIGICDANGKYLTLTNSGVNPTADYNTFTTNLGTKPATGQIYRFTPPPATGLEASKYCFTATTTTYQILAGASEVVGISAAEDDAVSNVVTLQFPFAFGGSVYTDIRVSSNGWLSFGAAVVTAAQNYVNSAANAALSKPILMPLWDDLRCTVKPRYLTTGSAPNRIFKLEWYKQKWDYQNTGDVISFQVWLYEGSNRIEYVYNQGAAASTTASATIGIYDSNNNYLTLSNSGTGPTAQTGTFTANIATKPASGQVYQFTPPPIITYPGNAYIAIGKVGVTQTGATGGAYSASPPGLILNSSTGEVNLSTSAGGTYSIVYTVAGCSNATAVMTIFPLLPVPTASVAEASCSSGTDGAITITNMNNAVKFIRADNDYIDLGSALLSNKSAFTIEGWIKFNSADVTGRMSLFGQNDAIEFGFANATTIELWTVATGFVTASLPASLGDGAWHHIAVVGNGSIIKIYLNGASVAVTGGVVTTSNYGSSSSSTKIGSGVYNATGDSFTGQVMKLGLFNTALSAIEITYKAIGPTTYSGYEVGIIAGYNFFIGSGTTLFSYPSGNNGTFQNTPEWIDPYNYYWQKIGDATFSATTKNLTNLSPGDYKVTVSLIGVSSPNAAVFTVGSAPIVTALSGSGANCTNTFTANWTASAGTISYSIDVATDPDFTTFVSGFNDFSVGNVTSYLLTGLPPGNIYYRVHKHSSCGASANSNVIVYETLQINSPTAIDATAVLCNGFTANWNAVSGATSYYLDIATDPSFSTYVSGYNNLSVGNVTSLIITPLASGFTYYYRVRSSNATCGTVVTPSNVVSVVINTGPTAPIVGSIQQITCALPGGSVALSGLPSGSWTLNFSSGESYSGSGGAITIPGLASGTYTCAVSEGVCFSSDSSNIVVNVSPISTTFWDGSVWSNGAPSPLRRVIFNGGIGSVFTVGADLNMCSCQINSGSVIINSGVVLSVQESLDVLVNTTLTFENNASLVQINDAAINTGTITYKRITVPMKNFDFTDWSSPVSGQTLKALSPNTLNDKYFSFWDRVWVTENSANVMDVGKGYTIRTPKAGVWGSPYPETVVFPYAQPVSFIGIPNNGALTVSVNSSPGRYSFIGNPYPSALDADLFIAANSSVIKGTIYIWTHNTPITSGGSGYVYSSDDYASYNSLGSTAAASSVLVGANTSVPLGDIAAGQGFFTISKTGTTGIVNFNNSMRVATSGSNSQFFKGSKTKKTATERHRVWLNLTNNQGAFKQTLIGYIAGATNGIDDAFDGPSNNKNAYVDFYSTIETKKFVIQGRPLNFDKYDEVPLGYKSTIDGTFSIAIEQADGVLANQDIFVLDKNDGIFHNLKKTSYTFTTLKGIFDNRFVLVYVDKSIPEVSIVIAPPVVVEPPVVIVPPVVVAPPVVVEPPVVIVPPVVVAPPIVIVPPVVIAPPVVVEPPVVIVPPVVVEPPVVIVPPVVVAPPVVVEPPVVIVPPVVVAPPVVIAPPVVVEPPVVIVPPVAVEPPVVIVPPVVVALPVVIVPPVIVEPPVVIVPPVVVAPPVVIALPVVVEPPVVIAPPVIVEPPVVIVPPVVVEPAVVIIPPVVTLDPMLENPDYNEPSNAVIVWANNHKIMINSFNEMIIKVMIYDLRGRLIYENRNVNQNELYIEDLNSANQFLILITQLKNGHRSVNRIIF
ncbi:Concanavalin A-like lectin/glucanases superfamily [Flavobacteriaceae bacterium]